MGGQGTFSIIVMHDMYHNFRNGLESIDAKYL